VNVLIACCLTGISTLASAGVVIGGTRVIYLSDKSDTTITVKNNEAAIPYLIQTWVDPFNNTGTAKKPPFTVIPPVSRLEAGQENSAHYENRGQFTAGSGVGVLAEHQKYSPGEQ
jgi:P pilus assembly chaperone PapD